MRKLIFVLCAVTIFAGCEKEEKVAANLRKNACETIEAGEMNAACKEAVDQMLKTAKAWSAPNLLADPEAVMLAGLGFCVEKYGPNVETKAEGNPTRLMGCNLGVFEGLTYSSHVLSLVQVSGLEKTRAKAAPMGKAIPRRYVEVVPCTTAAVAEMTDAMSVGCIGLTDLTAEQMSKVTAEIQSSHEEITVNGKAAEAEAVKLEAEIARVQADINAVRASTAQWRQKAAPMDNALSQTASYRRRAYDDNAARARLLEEERQLPYRISATWAERAQIERDTGYLKAEYRSLTRKLDDAEDEADKAEHSRKSAQGEYDSAKRKYDDYIREEERKEAQRRERERAEQARRDAEAARQRAAREKAELEARRKDSFSGSSNSGYGGDDSEAPKPVSIGGGSSGYDNDE